MSKGSTGEMPEVSTPLGGVRSGRALGPVWDQNQKKGPAKTADPQSWCGRGDRT